MADAILIRSDIMHCVKSVEVGLASAGGKRLNGSTFGKY
jgi:hypothetical protein